MAIQNDLDLLQYTTKIKAKVLEEAFKTRYPTFSPFETLRIKARQIVLLATGKTWTLNSKHLIGQAVDWVFMKNNQPSWDNSQGQYNLMQWVAAMCGMQRIKQELCHTEDNGVSIQQQMANNSKRRTNTNDQGEKYWLHLVNDTFKKYLNS